MKKFSTAPKDENDRQQSKKTVSKLAAAKANIQGNKRQVNSINGYVIDRETLHSRSPQNGYKANHSPWPSQSTDIPSCWQQQQESRRENRRVDAKHTNNRTDFSSPGEAGTAKPSSAAMGVLKKMETKSLSRNTGTHELCRPISLTESNTNNLSHIPTSPFSNTPKQRQRDRQVASASLLHTHEGSNDIANLSSSKNNQSYILPRSTVSLRKANRFSCNYSLVDDSSVTNNTLLNRNSDHSNSNKKISSRASRRDSRPPEETTTYQSLDVTLFPSNQPQRTPRKRAVIVGVNYVLTPDILLRGSCNDAAATALTLINTCDFNPDDVILLMDAFPSLCYRHISPREGERPGEFVAWKDRQPSRRNILLALNWLRADTIPGDVVFFYFAGHGIQVDDMSGWEGEGYDEAILPMDFYGEEVNAITAVMIRNLLLSVANDVQVTMVIDCNGGQTMLDPAGTGKWNFIKGVKQRGVWPFVTDATDKVARAVYEQTPWMDEAMKKRGARPRFVPGVDVSSTQELLDPTLQKPSAQVAVKVKGYLFAAAPWSQSAIEVKMPAIKILSLDSKGKTFTTEQSIEKQHTYHGVFTWCFLNSLMDLMVTAVNRTRTKQVSYRKLVEEIENRIKGCKSTQGGLPKLNQHPELTFYRSGGGEGRDFFLWPFGGRRSGVPYSQLNTVILPCFPHEQQYLSTWEAEEQLRRAGEIRRKYDPAFMSLRRHGLGQFSNLPTSQPSWENYNSFTGLSPAVDLTDNIMENLTGKVQTMSSDKHKTRSLNQKKCTKDSAATSLSNQQQTKPLPNASTAATIDDNTKHNTTETHNLDGSSNSALLNPTVTTRVSTLSTSTSGPVASSHPKLTTLNSSNVERFLSCPPKHLDIRSTITRQTTSKSALKPDPPSPTNISTTTMSSNHQQQKRINAAMPTPTITSSTVDRMSTSNNINLPQSQQRSNNTMITRYMTLPASSSIATTIQKNNVNNNTTHEMTNKSTTTANNSFPMFPNSNSNNNKPSASIVSESRRYVSSDRLLASTNNNNNIKNTSVCNKNNTLINNTLRTPPTRQTVTATTTTKDILENDKNYYNRNNNNMFNSTNFSNTASYSYNNNNALLYSREPRRFQQLQQQQQPLLSPSLVNHNNKHENNFTNNKTRNEKTLPPFSTLRQSIGPSMTNSTIFAPSTTKLSSMHTWKQEPSSNKNSLATATAVSS